MKRHVELLTKLGACGEGIDFAATQPDGAATWANCTRSDWLFWFVAQLAGPTGSASHRKLWGCWAEMIDPVVELLKPSTLRDRLAELALAIKRYAQSEADRTSADAELNFIREKVFADLADRAACADLADLADRAACADLADRAACADLAARAALADLAARAALAALDALDALAALAALDAFTQAYERADAKLCEIIRRHYPTAPELPGGAAPVRCPITGEVLRAWPSEGGGSR